MPPANSDDSPYVTNKINAFAAAEVTRLKLSWTCIVDGSYGLRLTPTSIRGIAFALLFVCTMAGAAVAPADFPEFKVSGHEKEMASLRDLFWLHYPSAGPKATLWDEWLVDASLWPAVTSDDSAAHFRKQWSTTLSSRILDAEGYVATHQHPSIAHQLGWPFPFWNQGRHGCG